MVGGYRRLSPADEDEIWARLRAGHAAKPTARALGWSTSGVRGYLERCGGIRPAPRRRSPSRLSLAEREEISRGLAACPLNGGVEVRFRQRIELSTGWAEWDEGPRHRVRVGDRLLPRRIEVTYPSTADDLPALSMVIEVRDGIPQCPEVTIRASKTGREVRSVDLRAARLEDWLETIVARAAAEATERGYVIDDRTPVELAQERKRVQYIRAGARRTITDDLLRQVADVYRAHASDRPTEAVQAAFGTSPRTAARYVQQARERGFLPPTTPGKVTT